MDDRGLENVELSPHIAEVKMASNRAIEPAHAEVNGSAAVSTTRPANTAAYSDDATVFK